MITRRCHTYFGRRRIREGWQSVQRTVVAAAATTCSAVAVHAASHALAVSGPREAVLAWRICVCACVYQALVAGLSAHTETPRRQVAERRSPLQSTAAARRRTSRRARAASDARRPAAGAMITKATHTHRRRTHSGARAAAAAAKERAVSRTPMETAQGLTGGTAQASCHAPIARRTVCTNEDRCKC
jgi:hypothetical protein